ncbi:MAG: hypothetical protein JO139_06900, partial [Alphaproteobacteria bacterium]|nr:hypothetical protein [Alphaproteobacteria bacterium]
MPARDHQSAPLRWAVFIPRLIGAVVLALSRVMAPTLLIVGSLDTVVFELNQMAYGRLAGPKELVIVEGATHLFEERERWTRYSTMPRAGCVV